MHQKINPSWSQFDTDTSLLDMTSGRRFMKVWSDQKLFEVRDLFGKLRYSGHDRQEKITVSMKHGNGGTGTRDQNWQHGP